MKRYDLITPEGTKDFLFEESMLYRSIKNKLDSIFKSCGYSEVVTPALEFFDVFNLNSNYFPQEDMYKLTDSKGRLMVLRPDSTMPIARMTATRLKDATLPLRLYYNQKVYRSEPALKGKSDEISQMGIELIGSSMRMADLEVCASAINSLEAWGMEYTLEIGHIGIFKELVRKLDVDDDTKEEIRKLIEMKNFPALNDILDTLDSSGNSAVINSIKKLPSLFGGEEVFEKALKAIPDEKVRFILDDIHSIYNDISSLCGENGKIIVDLGLVNKTDYYTGIILKGYLKGHGDKVLAGGRYDKLISEFGYDVPAVGFAVYVNAVANAITKNENTDNYKPSVDTIVYSSPGNEIKGLREAERLRNEGETVENALFETLEEVREYAKEKKISKIVVIDDNDNYDNSMEDNADE